VAIEVVAARVGSLLDPVVRLLDGAGGELAYCDDAPGIGPDARLSYTFAAPGKYFLELRDTRYEGGPKHRYRVRVAAVPLPPIPFRPLTSAAWLRKEADELTQWHEIEPNDVMTNATPIAFPGAVQGQFARPKDRDFYQFTVPKGQKLVFQGKTRSLGSPCDLFMQLYKADGTQLAEANPAAADEGNLTNTFAEAGIYRLMVEELNRAGGPEFIYRVEVRPFQPGFALSVDTDK